MEAREFLAKIEFNRIAIANKQAEKKYWLEMAEGMTANVSGERVQSSGDPHKMESKVIEAVLIDQEIERLKAEILGVIRMIERLKPLEYQFLHLVYVQGKRVKEVTAELGKSDSWSVRTHKKAIENLQELLDGESQG